MGVVKAGICVHIKDDDRSHLHIVITDPDNRNPQGVAIVSLRTYRPELDDTVLINPGDAGCHPFIKRPTCVAYIKSKVVEVARLEARIKDDLNFRHRDDCSIELLEKIREGLFKSSFSRESIKKYCKEQLAKQSAAPIKAAEAIPEPKEQ